MNTTAVYWLTRIGCINSTMQAVVALSILYLAVIGLIAFLRKMDPSFTALSKAHDAAKKPLKWVIAVAIISMALCHIIPTADEVKLIVMTQVAAEHGLKLVIEK